MITKTTDTDTKANCLIL